MASDLFFGNTDRDWARGGRPISGNVSVMGGAPSKEEIGNLLLAGAFVAASTIGAWWLLDRSRKRLEETRSTTPITLLGTAAPAIVGAAPPQMAMAAPVPRSQALLDRHLTRPRKPFQSDRFTFENKDEDRPLSWGTLGGESKHEEEDED
jgi:hypothetical protein